MITERKETNKTWLDRDQEDLIFIKNTATRIVKYSTIPTEKKYDLSSTTTDVEKIALHLEAIQSFAKKYSIYDFLNEKIIFNKGNKWEIDRFLANYTENNPETWISKDIDSLQKYSKLFSEISTDYENLHENSSDLHLFSHTRMASELLNSANNHYRATAKYLLTEKINEKDRIELDDIIETVDHKFHGQDKENEPIM